MKRTQLRSKDVSQILECFGLEISKKDTVELVEDDSNNLKLILLNRELAFFYHDERIVPTLQYLQKNPFLKKVAIDRGAIKFIINGADIMRPGITSFDQAILSDDIIMIVDQEHQKPLAVGFALMSSAELASTTSGKAVKNLHFVGDRIWTWKVGG